MSKYSRHIDLKDTNSAATKIIELVGKNKKVLEFGCAGGHMSKVLKEKCGCEIVGVEINPQDAKTARSYCKDVIVGDIEDFGWCKKLAGKKFDVAIFADVLEHLKRPERPLEKVREFLKDNGCVLVSVPNIANVSIRLELLSGGFQYEELGILDDTHLKYFTLKSIINLIESAKLYVDSVDYSAKDLPDKAIVEQLKPLGLRATKKTLKNFSVLDAVAYEFILKAHRKKPKGYGPYKFKEMKKPQRVMEEVFEEQAKQIERENRHIKGLEREQRESRTHIRNLEEARKKREAELGAFRKEREERALHIANLEKGQKERETELKAFKKERKVSRSEIAAFKKEREERTLHILNLEKEQKERESEIKAFKKERDEREVQLKNLEKERKERKVHIGNLEKERKVSRSEIEVFKKEREERTLHILNLEKAQKERESGLKAFKKERDDREAHLKNLEKERKERKVHIGNLEKERKASRSEIAAFKKEREERDQHILNLEKAQKEREPEIKAFKKERDEREAHLKNLEKEREDRRIHIGNLEKERKVSRSEIAAFKKEREERALHIANLEEVQKERETEIRAFKKERDEREAHLKNLEKERKERKVHMGNLEKERKASRSEIAAFKKEREERTLHIENLEEVQKERESEIKAFKKERDEREAHLKNLEKEREDRRIHIGNLEKERKASRSEIAVFKKEREERTLHIANLEEERKERRIHIKNLEEETEARRVEVKAFRKDRKERKRHVLNLEKEREERSVHIKNLEKVNDTDKNEIEAFIKDRAEKARHIAEIKQEKARLGGAFSRLCDELCAAQEMLTERETVEVQLRTMMAVKDLSIQHFLDDRAEKARHITEVKQEKARLGGAFSRLCDELCAAQEMLTEKEAEGDQLRTMMAVKDLSIQHFLDDRAEKARYIAEVKQEKARLGGAFSRLCDELCAAQEMLTEKEAEGDQLRKLLGEKDHAIDRFRIQSDSLEDQLAHERIRISLLLNSREWKLMAPARWVFRFIRKLRVNIATKFYPLDWEYRAIKKSGLFDATYYIDRNHDVKKLNMNPLVHYVKYGAKEGRHPHPLFDPHYYLAQNPDVAKFRINPLAHFVKYGVREGRDPNPLFDVGHYLTQNPEAAVGGMNPVAHYLEIGAGKGVNPGPLFDSNNYLGRNPDVAVSGINPLVHFVLYGAKEGRNPKPEPNKQIDPAESSAPLNSVEKIVYSSESGDVWKDATVSVIVPTLNAADDFATFLPVFKNQKGLQHIEIVVVDSGSTDNTVELAKKFGAKTIRIPPKAFSHSYARNLGAEHASGNYFLFITQDALPPSESWLHEMLSALKKSEAVAVSCAEFPREDVDLFYRISSWHHHRIMEFDKVDRLLSMPDVEDYLTLRKNAQLSDTACLISGDLFMKYKFRNDYAEDLDLGMRLIRDGHKLAFLCSTKIIHSHNRLPYYYLKRAYVDNLTLGQIFPDFQIPHIRIDEFAGDILYTYDIINCLVKEDLHDLTMPCNIQTFITAIKTKLCSTHSYGGLASEGISKNKYVDKNFKSFLRKIGSRYSVEEGIRYDGMLVHAIIAFVDIAVNYMTETYETIDDDIRHDFNACLYKAFAYQMGAHLCFCHLSVSDEKTKEVSKIVSDLTKGI